MPFFQWENLPAVEVAPHVKRKFVYLDNLMVVRYEIDAGAGDNPVHQHPHHEQITFVLHGQVEFVLGDERRVIGAGEGLTIPPNMSHGNTIIGPCVMIDVFSPIREDYLDYAS